MPFQYTKTAFLFNLNIIFFHSFSYLLYFLPRISGIPLSCQRKCIFSRFRRNVLPKREAVEDSYSVLKQKFNIASSFSNRLLCFLIVILFKKVQRVKQKSTKDGTKDSVCHFQNNYNIL